ncbi:unknown [Firmicutes bacterium CAG:646]|nr:unknown [Firmicutes bacterium CAG:646]
MPGKAKQQLQEKGCSLPLKNQVEMLEKMVEDTVEKEASREDGLETMGGVLVL